MAVTCSGTVRDPSGNPVANLNIILRAIGTNSVVLDGGELISTTGADGTYSFTIENGLYGAYISYGKEVFLGEFFIDNDTVDADLNTYLLTVDLGSAAIQAGIQFQQYVSDATEQANIATAQAGIATTQAEIASSQAVLVVEEGNTQVARVTSEGDTQTARASAEADRSRDEADRAQGIADNLGIFPPRTLSDLNAERAINNEMYAASGFAHFGKHLNITQTLQAINEGLWTRTDTENILYIGRNSATSNTTGDSKVGFALVNIAGTISELVTATDLNLPFPIKFRPAPDGTDTYNSATGVTVTHADAATAFAAETATNKVVTEPYDLFGLEAWLEEITVGNPYAYDRGVTQSQATNIDGVVTVATNRPATYYAVFDGDTGSNGRGIDWLSLTESQRNAISSNPVHNIYYDSENSRWLQWRIRQRTHRGAGNGNWSNIDPSVTGNAWLNFDGRSFLLPQGASDSPNSTIFQGLFVGINSGSGYKHSTLGEDGIFTAGLLGGGNVANAINGECYFLPMGIVPRLNQGAYHPSFNPMGARKFENVNGNGSRFWYESDSGDIISALNCLTDGTDTDAIGYHARTGLIGEDSGRPDGKFFDAVYASGQGGVIDNRLAASEPKATPVVTDGTWRGVANLVRTSIDSTTQTNNASINQFAITDSTKYAVGDKVILVNASNTFDVTANVTSVSASTVVLDQTFSRTAGNTHVVIEHELNQHAEDEILQSDVVGNPARILLTTALSGGWLGSWLPQIPTGSGTVLFELSRRAMTTSASGAFTTNSGASWTAVTPSVNLVRNTVSSSASFSNNVNAVSVWDYTASSKITEPSTNRSVFNNADGLGDIFITSDYRPEHGSLFAESVADLILKSDAGAINRESVVANRYLISDVLTSMSHLTTLMPVPTNDSQGVKVAVYELEIRGQLFLGFVANTMTYNTTNSSWGDTGSMFIPTGESSTFPDSNGTTQVARVEILNKPYGWFKNEI